MTTTPDYSSYDGRTRAPGWILDLIPGAPEAMATFVSARDAEREASRAESEASVAHSAADRRVRDGLRGASFSEADTARVALDAARAAHTETTRVRRRADNAVADLIRNQSAATRAATRTEAAHRALDAHERAVAALSALRDAVADLDEMSPRTGVSAGAGSPEDALLLAAEAQGLSPEQTEASFHKRGMTPPVAGRIAARRPLHPLATRVDVRAALRSVEEHLEGTPVEVLSAMAEETGR